MADDRLMLSALRTNQACSLVNNVSHKRCLIHVKLTDLCMKTVENLIDSEKGAFFSLWFDDNGGTMSIPVEQGESRTFQFKTAPLQEGEGQSSLECVHQSLVSSPPRDHVLSCWGTMEHKLTVQGTDDVYLRTKEKWESVEKHRKGQRTQQIKVPQSRSKTKAFQPVDRVSPVPVTYRKPNRPKPPPPSSSKTTSAAKIPRLPPTKLHAAQPKTTVPTSTPPSEPKPKSTSRSTHSLKDRIIYMLALKPHPREQIVAKLKKATKRSETAMSNLDSILNEVSDISQGMYRLKPQYLRNVDVEQWPFYNDAQKQMLKRSKDVGLVESGYEGSASSVSKRPTSEQQELPLKKLRLSQPVSESAVLSVGTASLHSSTASLDNATDSVQFKSTEVTSQQEGPREQIEHVNTSSNSKSKKKKKQKKVIATDPTLTTMSTPDHLSEFPTLTCEEERTRYKQVFNKEYIEYLSLKESIDQVANQNQRECSALSERLDSVPKNSEEYTEVKRLIQEKYLEYQQNRSYLENRSKFDELHQKLNHIKQMVLQYDAKHRTAV